MDNAYIPLSIIVIICQVITFTALFILCYLVVKIKKIINKYERHLLRTQQETSLKKVEAADLEIANRWIKQGEESPTRVPSPVPTRRLRGMRDKPRSQSTNTYLHGTTETFRDLLFTSPASPRDSGVGSVAARTPQSSISYETKHSAVQDSLGQRNTSGDFQEKSFEPDKEVLEQEWDVSKNENELGDSHLSRCNTMSIEMIGLEDSDSTDERKQEKGTGLKQRQETIKEVPDAYSENEGYSDDCDVISSGSVFPKELTISIQGDMGHSSNSRFISQNVVKNEDEKDKYVKLDSVEVMRHDDSLGPGTDGPNTEKSNCEPLFITRI